MSAQPKTHADPAEVKRKTALLAAPHMAPLTAFVKRLRRAHGDVPWFDPADGGVNARLLLLLQDPGDRSTAALGSGFISCDNNDDTASACWRLLRDGGIERSDVVFWNVVPWYVGNGKIRTADLPIARPALQELLDLLPELRGVVAMGRWAREGMAGVECGLPQLTCLHPSPYNMGSRNAYPLILATLIEARETLL